MRVLDLFSGLGGWSAAFKDRGHEVVTVDIEEKFNPTICCDIGELKASEIADIYGPVNFDVVLASPPCNCFSVASCYRHWKNGMPQDERTKKAIELVLKTISLVYDIKPKFWVMENPRGMLRKVIGKPLMEVTQCQYGRPVMEPTDLWGNIPVTFKPKRCKNTSPCHALPERGSHEGTQGIKIESFNKNHFAYLVPGGGGNAALRAQIPYGLSLSMCIACEEASHG